MGVDFINIDLEVCAQFDLSPLSEAFGDEVFVLFCGETAPGSFLLSMELGPDEARQTKPMSPEDPDLVADAFCQLIEGLPDTAQRAWHEATDKRLDIGFDAVKDSRCGQPLLSARTLQRMSALNLTLFLSVYTNNLTSVPSAQ